MKRVCKAKYQISLLYMQADKRQTGISIPVVPDQYFIFLQCSFQKPVTPRHLISFLVFVYYSLCFSYCQHPFLS
ncbi:hypothetical protein ANACAC_03221 [Anaerostipes caccae L1-92]|uniref:Uncharacterized protein n=1 Tax=Anaerostipes caccae (strain DSM 14662 / CCUG 47493 / JCM 13470 / NCIMB 13811 / L1-92) TaxID=411490 RepID=B0MGY4_ANACD|nr:hypothetical protein ANACAC_03221 [Anaerostipes caccae L1-92]